MLEDSEAMQMYSGSVENMSFGDSVLLCVLALSYRHSPGWPLTSDLHTSHARIMDVSHHTQLPVLLFTVVSWLYLCQLNSAFWIGCGSATAPGDNLSYLIL